ncbi:MAG TPA: M28 family peptidase [Gemmatimonadaceae bacterium]|nr:M28 family peptidase [Gemmatimonadaceae bacterium]
MPHSPTGVSALSAIALAAMGFAGDASAQRSDPFVISVAELGARLRHLSADSMLGRYPGTRGETLTTRYLVGELQAFGAKPGFNGSWLQPVTIATHRPDPQHTSEARLVGRIMRELVHGRDLRLANFTGKSDAFAAGDLVFVGYGIHAPMYGWDDFAGVDLRGKVPVALLGEPSLGNDTSKFNAGRASRFARLMDKTLEMERRGAVGVLWLRPTNSFSRAPPTGPARLTSEVAPQGMVFSGNIAENTVAALLPEEADPLAELVARAGRPGFRAVPLDVRLEVRFRTAASRITSHNVIGVVPGTDPTLANEHIVISSHWDAYGVGQPVNGDSIYNGALDDASGMTAALALARVFAANPQPRSITFLFTTAEEMGLLGAQEFVCNGPIPVERIVANLNLDDGIELFGIKRDVAPLGIELSSLGRTVAEVARAKGLRVSPDPFPQEGFFLRADNFPFARAGVPALYVALGTEDAEGPRGWTVSKTKEYLEKHYHRPSDDYETVVHDLRGSRQFAEFARDLTRAIARAPQRPEWLPGVEFSRRTESGLPPACRR